MNQFKKLKIIRSEDGFTLVEILVVIALLGMIGTFVVTQLTSRFNRAKVDSTKIQMRQLGNVLDIYKLDCGTYPTTEQGLEALLSQPESGPECSNYDPNGYLKSKSAPKDGFKKGFLYESDGNSYEIISLGNDGKEGGEGIDKDISSSDLN